jgi:flavin-dependent thymidylate synthase
MKVTLIEFSGSGWPDPADRAATVLIFTKNTRLQMSPGGLEEIAAWPHEKKMKELEYMANTIPSSHEFCDYTFMIEGVTRAFTHQLVRTRTASFAQQTLRILDVSEGNGWDYATGPTIEQGSTFEDQPIRAEIYHDTMKSIARAYRSLIGNGAAIEDARGILPTNILTNIVMKCNMRTFVELVRKRSSSRTQGEYREVLEDMKDVVRAMHPWIDLFIDRTMDRAISDLEKLCTSVMGTEERMRAVKLLDQIRGQS